MKKILHLTSSPNGAASFSNRLSQAILEKLAAAHPGNSVQTRDLANQSFPHVAAPQVAAFFTPPEAWTDFHKDAAVLSESLIAELQEADIIVIAVAMHNFGIPSTLKAWMDHIVRAGITFRFTESGVEGLVHNKQVILAIASGSIYSEGPYKSYDFTEPYLRAILGFIGITDVKAFRVEGTAIPGVQDTALDKAVASISL